MRCSQEKIEKLVEEQRSSGKTVREFCVSQGLSPEVFYGWRQRIRKGRGEFARVETTGGRRIELELSGGVTLRVSIADLKAVLEVLR